MAEDLVLELLGPIALLPLPLPAPGTVLPVLELPLPLAPLGFEACVTATLPPTAPAKLLLMALLLLLAELLLLLPDRKLFAVEGVAATPELEVLEEFGRPVAAAELLPDDIDDLPEAFDLRCLDEDETLLPLLDRLVELAANVLLLILMLVAEVEAEFMVESISFSGDEHESEEVSCCTGL